MTRVIKSRRAGLSRDQARQQPLYARLLGLQYLAPSGFLCFVFFEGAVALGVLLALAELVSWWGVLVLPMTVAAMVKLNDVVAGALTHPVARSRGARDVSRFAASEESDDTALLGADHPLPAASSPALRRAAVRPAAVPPAGPIPPAGPVPPVGPIPPVGPFRPAAVPVAGPTPSQTVQWWAPRQDRDEPVPGNVDYRSWRPGAWTSDRQFADSQVSATRTRPTIPAVDVTGSGAPNEPPAARRWPASGESLDDPGQWARQAASRRYD